MIGSLAAFALGLASPSEFRLVVGERHAYELQITYIESDRKETTESVEHITYEVVKVDAARVAELRVTRRLKSYFVDGQKVPLPANQTPTVRTERRNPLGEVRERQAAEFFPLLVARQERILDFRYPGGGLAVGQRWETRTPEARDGAIPAARWTWTINQVNAMWVGLQFTFRETQPGSAITANGSMVLDGTSGWPAAARVEAQNARIPGDEESRPVTLRFSLKRLMTPIGG